MSHGQRRAGMARLLHHAAHLACFVMNQLPDSRLAEPPITHTVTHSHTHTHTHTHAHTHAQGFWHSSPFSQDVVACPLPRACAFPNRSLLLAALQIDLLTASNAWAESESERGGPSVTSPDALLAVFKRGQSSEEVSACVCVCVRVLV